MSTIINVERVSLRNEVGRIAKELESNTIKFGDETKQKSVSAFLEDRGNTRIKESSSSEENNTASAVLALSALFSGSSGNNVSNEDGSVKLKECGEDDRIVDFDSSPSFVSIKSPSQEDNIFVRTAAAEVDTIGCSKRPENIYKKRLDEDKQGESFEGQDRKRLKKPIEAIEIVRNDDLSHYHHNQICNTNVPNSHFERRSRNVTTDPRFIHTISGPPQCQQYPHPRNPITGFVNRTNYSPSNNYYSQGNAHFVPQTPSNPTICSPRHVYSVPKSCHDGHNHINPHAGPTTPYQPPRSPAVFHVCPHCNPYVPPCCSCRTQVSKNPYEHCMTMPNKHQQQKHPYDYYRGMPPLPQTIYSPQETKAATTKVEHHNCNDGSNTPELIGGGSVVSSNSSTTTDSNSVCQSKFGTPFKNEAIINDGAKNSMQAQVYSEPVMPMPKTPTQPQYQFIVSAPHNTCGMLNNNQPASNTLYSNQPNRVFPIMHSQPQSSSQNPYSHAVMTPSPQPHFEYCRTHVHHQQQQHFMHQSPTGQSVIYPLPYTAVTSTFDPLQMSSSSLNLATTNTKQRSYSRKDKSLGLLCANFMSRYGNLGVCNLPQSKRSSCPVHGGQASIPYNQHQERTDVGISIDEAATALCVERRRIYDIINILESIHIVSRKCKNTYYWHGTCRLPIVFARMQVQAAKMWPEDAKKHGIVIPEHLKHPLASSKGKINTGESHENDKVGNFFEEGLFDIDDGGPTNITNTQKEKSLGKLSQEFLQLFLAGYKVVSLADATEKILGGSSICVDGEPWNAENAKKAASWIKTKGRRLYDIANVMASIGIIKICSGEQQTLQNEQEKETDSSTNPNYQKNKRSFVWKYYLKPQELQSYVDDCIDFGNNKNKKTDNIRKESSRAHV